MPREEYQLKEEIRSLRRKMKYLEKELKNPAGIKEGALTDREKMVLHFCCSMTIAKMTDVTNHKAVIEKMVEDIRMNRCRSLSEEDVVELLDEVNEEMVAGRNMFKFLIDETIPDVKGDQLPHTHRWEDLK